MAKRKQLPQSHPTRLKAFLIPKLRRAGYMWPPRAEALKRAKVAPNTYECKHCKGHFHKNLVKIDHIIPVVDPVKGYVDIQTWIERMFIEVDGFQVLCDTCHDKKTEAEDEIRHAELAKKKGKVRKRSKRVYNRSKKR